MNIEELQTKTAYKCLKCNEWFLDKELALKHCTPKKCRDCGKEISSNDYHNLCSECDKKRDREWLQELFDKGKKYTPKTVPLESSGMYCYPLGRFRDNVYEYEIDSLIDTVVENIEETPKFIFGTIHRSLELDAYSILERACEDLECGAQCILEKNINDLQDFLDKWCQNINIGWYEPDYKTVIILDKSLL